MHKATLAITTIILIGAVLFLNQTENRGATPSDALNTCISAVKTGDMKTFSEYTIDGDRFWSEWKAATENERELVKSMLPQLMGEICFFDYEVTEQELTGDSATLWVEIEGRTDLDDPEKVIMKKEGGRWKIEIAETYR